MNSSELIKAIYDCEVNCRIEWFWDGGFTWSVLNGQTFPRLWADDRTDNAMVPVFESSESVLLHAQPLAEKDWHKRGSDHDFDQAVRDMAQAVIDVYPACADTIKL